LRTGCSSGQAAQSFDLDGFTPRGGGAQAIGTVTFTTKHAFKFSLQVRDVCPADGYGADVRFALQHPDGTTTMSRKYEDVNGCGSKYESYAGTIMRDKVVSRAVVALYYEDAGVELQAIDDTVLDNPHVG
jgi:hypothetical protein